MAYIGTKLVISGRGWLHNSDAEIMETPSVKDRLYPISSSWVPISIISPSLSLSVVFVIAILKGGTYYKKWMAIFNPIVILLLVFSTLFWAKDLGKHLAPIAMNVTHFILFALSLYQLNKLTKSQQ